MDALTLFDDFAAGLSGPGAPDRIRAGLIGDGMPVPGPFGAHPLVYADYTASGRALMQVEDFIRDHVLPWYANSHTEASWCGAWMTRLRRAARQVVARATGADDDCAVIFAGSGATAGLNRLVHLLGIPACLAAGGRPLVILGPYEHHSNILPWRESGAEVIEIPEGADGGPCLTTLAQVLDQTADRPLRIGAFSAASNVTGILTDTVAVGRMLAAQDVRSVWDYAGAGPYVAIDMAGGTDHAKDAVVLSPHKFIGGPGASGLLILRRGAVAGDRPSLPGGGTVRFVSPQAHDYTADVVAREEAGTPNVIGDIRAALALLVKQAAGQGWLDRRHAELTAAALDAWGKVPELDLLGLPEARRLPIFSFRIRDGRGGFIHHQLFTRMLSDVHGIQARGGCACAGPYAHRLLSIGEEQSMTLRQAILSGDELAKPGWVRLNLSAFLTAEKLRFVLTSVAALARDPGRYAAAYCSDPATARFRAEPGKAA